MESGAVAAAAPTVGEGGDGPVLGKDPPRDPPNGLLHSHIPDTNQHSSDNNTADTSDPSEGEKGEDLGLPVVEIVTPGVRPVSVPENEQCPTDNEKSGLLNDSQQDETKTNSIPSLTGQSKDCTVVVERKACDISFHDISYTIQERAPGKLCGPKQDKSVLNNISGVCRPGLTAILGATGSGKTSLLDVLACRKDKHGLKGQVLVDGAPQPANFQCMSGYVLQDDILMGMLTVRENISFSAALRLPSSTPQAERQQRISDVITELGLDKCADSKVGTELRRGISGGERKRACIAMELITAPSFLFLDEPTTGLDATTAHTVIYLLKRLSQCGRTVVLSLHQPRYSIFKLFDRLLLLQQGDCVYQGPASDALPYFTHLGYPCEAYNNPADHFLDVLSAAAPDETTADLLSKDAELPLIIDKNPDAASPQKSVSHLREKFEESEWGARLQSELKAFDFGEDTVSQKPEGGHYPTGFCTQLNVVCSRTFKNMVRNPHTMATQVASALILALLVGCIYFQIDDSYKSGIQNRVGVFFFIVMNYVFGNMAAVDIFIKDRALFIHENVSGFYRVSVYFFAKLLCDVIPQRAVPVIVFTTITYWMIGLQTSAVQFGIFMLNTFLTAIAGTSVALTMSASCATHTIGTIFTALIWVAMMVFSGLLVNLGSVPRALRWLKWGSIFRYSMNAFTVNELEGQEYCDVAPVNGTAAECMTGNSYMERQDIPHGSPLDLWLNEIALVIITALFLLLTYVQLRRIKKRT